MQTKYFQEVPIDQNKKIVFERNEQLYVLFEKTETKILWQKPSNFKQECQIWKYLLRKYLLIMSIMYYEKAFSGKQIFLSMHLCSLLLSNETCKK